MSFANSLAAVKAQGASLLTDAKTYLEGVATKVAGDLESDLPIVSQDAVAVAMSFITNPLAQSIVNQVISGSQVAATVDAAAVAWIGAGLLRIEAVLAGIPGGAPPPAPVAPSAPVPTAGA